MRLAPLFYTLLLLAGCAKPSLEQQAKLLGTRPFAVDQWAAANQEERGAMLASFLALHPPKALTGKQIEALLGTPTGYFHHDANPAYFVGPATVDSEFGKGYLLAFVTDKQTGKVVDVQIHPQIEKDS